MRKSISNYLKTIYEASYAKSGTNNKQIATMLGVLPGSVTEAVNHLEKAGLVVHQTYHQIALTKAGYQIVCDLMFRYRLCEVWLTQKIKLPLPSVPKQAWLMAAINDQELLRRLNQQLAQPAISPFGGQLELPAFEKRDQRVVQSLDTVGVNETIIIDSYLESPSTVKYWQHTSLQLGEQLTLVESADALPVLTLVDDQDNEYLINAAVARYIYAKPVSVQSLVTTSN
ncbi:metal-dependent transcriptional regulator [Lactiplantibacillus modestisalitolerans]|uniref:Metal-dependent transcriptional regulator n=1 Tax=Lactiplantibacillus modestisalitolerans TaxID=1457219 RepID=A0ABV5WR89_9LACO|nr:metal-dependent transcriptional regulator [Lactiplantibacillus modestisalitolerans]